MTVRESDSNGNESCCKMNIDETLLFVGKKCKGVEMQGLFCKPTNHFLKYIKHWVISTTLKKWCFFEKFQNPSKMPLERILTIFFRTKQKIVAYATFWKMRHHLVFGSGILRITVSEQISIPQIKIFKYNETSKCHRFWSRCHMRTIDAFLERLKVILSQNITY